MLPNQDRHQDRPAEIFNTFGGEVMEKPKKLYHQWRKIYYYEADEIDAWLDSAGEGLPEKVEMDYYGESTLPYNQTCVNVGFNNAIDLCTLAIAQHYIRRDSVSVERIKQLITSKELVPSVCEDSGQVEWSDGEATKLATTIHKLIGGNQ